MGVVELTSRGNIESVALDGCNRSVDTERAVKHLRGVGPCAEDNCICRDFLEQLTSDRDATGSARGARVINPAHLRVAAQIEVLFLF